MGSQWGRQGISGTYLGARAVAGSSSFFNLAPKEPDVPWGLQAASMNIDAYGPTAMERTNVRKSKPKDSEDMNRGFFDARSVAFTDFAPNSAAQSFTGNGPAAVARGWEVGAAARAGKDRKADPVTLGHRDGGGNGAFDAFGGDGAAVADTINEAGKKASLRRRLLRGAATRAA
jgi:hypothetical protein